MFITFFPDKDGTIYESTASINTGLDEILEISKKVFSTTSGSPAVIVDKVENSRILMKFDLTDISASVVAGTIPSGSEYFLRLFTCEAQAIPSEYDLVAFPISGSWVQGVGSKDTQPFIQEGASWRYRDGAATGTEWLTSSFAVGSTGSFVTTPGGGNWYTGSFFASQSFRNESTDLKMNVTHIVTRWLNGTLPNEGFVIMKSGSQETDLTDHGSLKFFSMDTHTIYPPKLEAGFDDQVFNTGSLSELTSEENIYYSKNLRREYNNSEIAKIRIAGRERFPTAAFVTKSVNLTNKFFQTSSYYSIRDAHTNDEIVPFDDNYTKISCDATGNYISLRMNSLQPERWYRLVLKIVKTETTEVIDKNFNFKVRRS